MTTTRADIVAEAVRWLGTPFRHQGRLRGVGADCGGLVLGVGQSLGLISYDAKPVYGRRPGGNEMRDICDRLLTRKGPDDPVLPGDILLLAWDEEAQHVGIADDRGGVIHVYAQARKCVQHRLDEVWCSRIRGVYSFRGLD